MHCKATLSGNPLSDTGTGIYTSINTNIHIVKITPVSFANMHYLSSSSASEEVLLTTKQRDLEQYGYERGWTVYDELTQSMSLSSVSEHPDFLAILLASSSDSSVSEQSIVNVEYSDFAAVLNESRDDDPLKSTQNQEALSRHLQVSLNSRINDRPTGQAEPNMRLGIVPEITPLLCGDLLCNSIISRGSCLLLNTAIVAVDQLSR